MTALQQAARALWRQPRHSLLTVVILALGIGSTLVMFTLVNALLLRPLPYPDAQQLVRIYRTQGSQRAWPHSAHGFQELRRSSALLDGVAAWNARSFSLAEAGVPAESLGGLEVSADFFRVLGAQPELGRLFLPEEDSYQRNAVVVLSARLWRSRFGGDPAIVGRRLPIDGELVQVVGIVPAQLNQPMLWGQIDVWRPLGLSPALLAARGNNWLEVMARRKPGVSLAAAEDEARALGRRILGEHAGASSLRIIPLHRSGMDETSTSFAWLAMGLAGLVLLIVCSNVGTLALVRHAARARELAVRVALGAGRGRLWQHLLIESSLLALVGGGLGLLAASWCVELLGRHIVVGSAPPGLALPIDGRVQALAGALTMLAALVVGSLPLLMSLDGPARLGQSTRLGNQRSSDAASPGLRRALVVAQMSLALVLLAASVLFLRGLDRVSGRDPGWTLDGLLTARVDLTAARHGPRAQRQQFLDRLDRRLAEIPGVQAGAISWWLPLASAGPTSYLTVQDAPQLQVAGQEQRRAENDVTPGFFTALGLRLLAGRTFTAADGPTAAAVAIINETMARRFWPVGGPQAALGKRIGRMGDPVWATVVGVVADVRYPAKLSSMVTRLQVYRPLAQQPRDGVVLHLRSDLPPATLAASLRQAVAELDPGLPVQDVLTARQALSIALNNVSLMGFILLAYAVTGMLLAAVGIYGLFSGFVVQRTREIGVRIALGAVRGQVLRLILMRGLRLAGLGILLGLPLAFGAGPLLAAMAPELPASDPAAVLVLAALLLALALLACWFPARRAAAVDPLVALRQD